MLLALIDMACVGIAMSVAYAVRVSPITQPLWARAGLSTAPFIVPIGSVVAATLLYQFLIVPFVMYAFGWYAPEPHERGRNIFARVGIVTVLIQYPLLGLLYLVKAGYIPRGLMLVDFALLSALVPAWRVRWAKRERARLDAGEHMRNVLFVGATPNALHVASEIIADTHFGMRVVGFLSDAPPDWSELSAGTLARSDVWVGANGLNGERLKAAVAANVRSRPRHIVAVVGGYSRKDIDLALDGLLAEEVFLSADVGREDAERVVRACRERGIRVHVIPRHYPELATAPSPWQLGPFTIVSLYPDPLSKPGWAAKRVFDIAAGTLGLIAASPIILLTAAAIKIESPREPVFFWSTRIGLKGRPFRMLKFRTMVANAEKYEAELKRRNKREGPWFKIDAHEDPRLTRVGRFVRKYSINELPQIINIIVGDMSIVGPRPPLPDEVADYVEYDFRYYRCLDVKPGLTGLWQVTGRSDPSFEKRIDLDLQYIRDWTFWLDLKLILMTPFVVLRETED